MTAYPLRVRDKGTHNTGTVVDYWRDIRNNTEGAVIKLDNGHIVRRTYSCIELTGKRGP